MPSIKMIKSGTTPTYFWPECWMEMPPNEMASNEAVPEAVLKRNMEV